MKIKVPVVAAVISRVNDQTQTFEVALFQRKQGDSGAGLWEFPGGKVEAGETYAQALKREIQEELSLDVTIKGLVGKTTYEFPDRIIELDVYWVETSDYRWALNEHDGAVWVTSQSWKNLNVAPMDIPLIEKVFSENS